MERIRTTAWISLLLAAALMAVGAWLLPSLPPTVPVLIAVPMLFLGSGAWVISTFGTDQGVYGRITQRLPYRIHPVVQGLAAVMIAVATLWLIKQPGPEAAPLFRRIAAVQDACRSPSTRVERHLFDLLDGIDTRLQGVPSIEQTAAHQQLEPVLQRCLERTREAFERPEGTHRSWLQLRDWLHAHPWGLPTHDPIWTASAQGVAHPAPTHTVEVMLSPE